MFSMTFIHTQMFSSENDFPKLKMFFSSNEGSSAFLNLRNILSTDEGNQALQEFLMACNPKQQVITITSFLMLIILIFINQGQRHPHHPDNRSHPHHYPHNDYDHQKQYKPHNQYNPHPCKHHHPHVSLQHFIALESYLIKSIIIIIIIMITMT